MSRMNLTSGRTIRLAGAALSLVLLLLASTAGAAFWQKKKDAPPPPRKAANLEQYPEMEFFRGTLRRASFGAWELNGCALRFLPEVLVSTSTASGGPAMLRDGRQVLLQGYLQDGALVAYQITLFDLDQTLRQNRFVSQRVSGQPRVMPRNVPQ